MSARRRLVAWTAALYGAVLAVPAAFGVLLAAGLPGDDGAALARILEQRTPVLLFAAFLLLVACAGDRKSVV